MRFESRNAVRPILDVAIPGLYAWVVTVAWPLRAPDTNVWAYAFAGIALLSLGASCLLVASRLRLWSAISVGTLISASATTWFLLGAEMQSLGILGSLGWAAFAIGWVRASGTYELGGGTGAAVLALAPRREVGWSARLLVGIGVVGALIGLALAWRIEGRERALLGHAIALLGALQVLTISSSAALTVGQKAESPAFPWTALGRTIVLAILVAVGGWFSLRGS